MTQKLSQWWEQISQFGVSESLSSSERMAVVLLNQTAVVGVAFELLVYVKQLIVNGVWLNPPTFIMVPLTLSIFVFHYKQLFYEARLFINIVFPLLIAGIVIYYGIPLHAEYAFFIFVTTAVVFFRERWPRALLVFYNTLLFLLSYFYSLANPSPREYMITSTEPVIIFISTVACIAIIIAAYINEIRRKEQELEHVLFDLQGKNEKLLNAYQEIERFAYITSHDLKTPLRNISSFIGLLELKIQAQEYDEVDEYLQFIKEGSQRMHGLIQDSLEYARVERLDNEPYQRVDLNHLVREIVTELAPMSPQIIDLKTNNLPIVVGRRLHLHLLLQNLLENGVKYNDKANVCLSVICHPTTTGIELAVQDNGIGIDNAYQSQIFEMFKRLHTEKEYPGTGIGLSICKKIVEKMGGKISLHSVPGKGSTFTLHLPLSVEAPVIVDKALEPV